MVIFTLFIGGLPIDPGHVSYCSVFPRFMSDSGCGLNCIISDLKRVEVTALSSFLSSYFMLYVGVSKVFGGFMVVIALSSHEAIISNLFCQFFLGPFWNCPLMMGRCCIELKNLSYD